MAYPYREEAATWPLEWAISAGTPLVTTSHANTREICGEGAWYAPDGDLDAWAHQMMLLYKDEHQRNKLIEKENSQHQLQNQSLTLDQYALFIRQLSA
jgi:glycosyltransferase involved in cell wall biosynthesis